MEQISHLLLVTSRLVFTAVALSAVSQRLGVPSLLVFLAVGLLATELPGAPRVAFPVEIAALIGNLALAVLLLDGGLRTPVGTLRMVAGPAMTLATVVAPADAPAELEVSFGPAATARRRRRRDCRQRPHADGAAGPARPRAPRRAAAPAPLTQRQPGLCAYPCLIAIVFRVVKPSSASKPFSRP